MTRARALAFALALCSAACGPITPGPEPTPPIASADVCACEGPDDSACIAAALCGPVALCWSGLDCGWIYDGCIGACE